MASQQGEVSKDDIKRYRSNYAAEVDGVELYRLLAEAEREPSAKAVYRRLAEIEARHRDLWVQKLQDAGELIPRARPSTRVKLLGWLARRFGTDFVASAVIRMESSGVDMYDSQPEAVAAGLPAEERSHARLLQKLASNKDGATASQIARLEGRHRMTSGNALRAGVLGVNDGLVSTLVLVMGVAGADPGRNFVFLSGITGLLAGSISMALGEWVSVRSSAEAFQREVEIERDEIEADPEGEKAELALIYEAKGLPPAMAEEAADRIFEDKDVALDTLAREELGMDPDEGPGSPWVAAITSFLLFAVGAFLPVIPWAFFGGFPAIVVSASLAGVGLFVAGAATSFFSGKPVWLTGGRMLVLGLAAAGITYGIGAAVGVGIGI